MICEDGASVALNQGPSYAVAALPAGSATVLAVEGLAGAVLEFRGETAVLPGPTGETVDGGTRWALSAAAVDALLDAGAESVRVVDPDGRIVYAGPVVRGSGWAGTGVTQVLASYVAGPSGRGIASITAEGATATVAYTDGSVGTFTLPSGLQGDPGRDGADGADGHTPVLAWQGAALAVDGVPGPDLRGPAGADGAPGADGADGAPGPANNLAIGTVTTLAAGSQATASITGAAPAQTLSLGIPQGADGTGGGGSASPYVIVGPGRPDVPSTTAGTITGSEPVGAEYRSMDGASVGAWTWQKVGASSWRVSTMDSGWRVLATVRKSDSGVDNSMTARVRVTADVTFVEMTVTVTAATSWQTFAVNDSWVQDHYMTPGVSGPIGRKDAFHLGTPYAWGIRPESYPRKVYIQGGGPSGLPVGTWVLSGRFPTPDTIPATLGPAA